MAIVPITLEQLDSYGTVEQLNTVSSSIDDLDFIDYTNLNLEQLDNYGDLDNLPFGLDSSNWQNVFVRFGKGNLTSNFTSTANAIIQETISGSTSFSFALSASSIRQRIGLGSLNVNFVVGANSNRIRLVDLSSTSNFNHNVNATRIQIPTLNSSAQFTSLGTAVFGVNIYGSESAIFFTLADANATFIDTATSIFSFTSSGVLNKQGDEWSDATSTTETWTPQTSGNEIWSLKNSGTETWN